MKTRKLVTAMAVGAIGVVALAAPALAHVEIDPPEAAQGSTTTITFHVPNEETASDTVKVDVKLPDDHPIATATAQPVEGGWTAEIIKSSSGNVSEVVWTGGKLGPGAELELGLTVGPLPTDVTELTFPTIQTYSDGTEVAWIEQTPASGVEPEHPMPTLELTAPPGGSSTSSSAVPTTTAPSTSSGPTTTTPAPVTTAVKKDDDSKLPLIAAVVVVLVIVVGAGLYVRSRRA